MFPPVKSALFAFLVATIAFYKGLNVRNGSREISEATTQSVVTAVIVVTIANAVVATPNAQGQICIHSFVPTHVIVDVSGFFA